METSNPETLKFSSLTALRSGLTQPARGPVVMLYSLTLHVTVFTLSQHHPLPCHIFTSPLADQVAITLNDMNVPCPLIHCSIHSATILITITSDPRYSGMLRTLDW
jgi:hypothetical protein